MVISKRHTTGIKWIFEPRRTYWTSKQTTLSAWNVNARFYFTLDSLWYALMNGEQLEAADLLKSIQRKQRKRKSERVYEQARNEYSIPHFRYVCLTRTRFSFTRLKNQKTSRKNIVEVVVAVASKLGLRITECFNWNVNLGNSKMRIHVYENLAMFLPWLGLLFFKFYEAPNTIANYLFCTWLEHLRHLPIEMESIEYNWFSNRCFIWLS